MNDVYGAPCKLCGCTHPGEPCPIGFPFPQAKVDCLTLRDQFAIASITGTLPGKSITNGEVFDRARLAYRVADAMITVRAEAKEPRHDDR